VKLRHLGELGAAVQERLQTPLDPKDHESNMGKALARQISSSHDHLRGMIAAHTVQGDGDWVHRVIRAREVVGRSAGYLGLNDVTPIIGAARLANVMRQFALTAIRTFDRLRCLERMMRATHVAPRR